MILSQRRWEQVVQWFTDDEILAINNARLPGPLAMQRGFKIDEKRLNPELRAKLAFHFMPLPVAFPARIARAAS